MAQPTEHAGDAAVKAASFERDRRIPATNAPASRIGPLDWIARRSLRARIGVGLALLVFLVAGLVGGLVGRASEAEAQARIGQSLAVDAQRLAERLNTEMSTRARELSLLASTDALREVPAKLDRAAGLGVAPVLTPALARTQALLDELKRSFPAYTWIAVATPAGRVLAATDPASLGQDISIRVPARESPKSTPGIPRSPEPTSADQRPEEQRTMDLVQPIRDIDGVVVGVIVARLSWSWIRAVERSVITPDSDGVSRRESLLLSSQDTVLLGPLGSAGLTLPLAAAARARAGFYGWAVEQWPTFPGGSEADSFLTGIAFAAGDGPAPGSQAMRWSVLVREAQQTAFAAASRLREQIWEAGLGIALIFAATGWLLAGMVTAPLARIAAAAERLRLGDDVEIPRIRGPAEIESLSNSLRALVATLTRKQQALDEMEELALRDPLTGLLNRHGLRISLEAVLVEAQQTRASLMVFVGDLDGFKSVNDTLGHATGDQLLCQVATRLVRSVRSDDLVARVGGDEFVLALLAPGGSSDLTALAVAERAQASIQQPFVLGGRTIQIGCSLGGACWPDHVTADGQSAIAEVDEVMQHADAALYAVKRSGKGRVAVHRLEYLLPAPDRQKRVDSAASTFETGDAPG